MNTIESISVNGTTIAIDNKNVNITVPTKLSQLSNDKEYLTQSDLTTISITKSQITDFPTSMPASDVYDWAKSETKPSYSFDEITGDINKDINGNASSATALTSSAGSVTQPIYFLDGKPVACTYALYKSVPSDAVFTDTTYSDATQSDSGLMSPTDKKKLDETPTKEDINTYIEQQVSSLLSSSEGLSLLGVTV